MSSQPVLMLNQDYQPLSICSVRKSLLLLFLDKAELIHEHPTLKIKTVNKEFDYPSVIRLKKYANIPFKRIVLARKNIFKRDGNKCVYCGSHSDLTIDHVVPKSKGGADTWENLVTACNKCNNKKGDRTPEAAGMNMNIIPYRPSNVMFLRNFSNVVDETWKPYLYI